MATIRRQIEILKEKGMKINSPSAARFVLKTENYYNVINAYKDLFLDLTYVPSCSTEPAEKYKEGVEFEELHTMFIFDKSLRELFLKYFLIIENQFKTHLAYEFSLLYGEDGYLNHLNFEFTQSNSLNVIELESIINATIYQNRNTDRIKHFYANNKHIPIWALVSFFEIGKIRKFFINCKTELKENVARYYGINTLDLISMISTINMFRNVCAHDNRLYCYKINDANKQVADTPLHANMHISTVPTKTGSDYILGKKDLFACVISLRYLLSETLFSNFFDELIEIINSLDGKIKSISIDSILNRMGFPLENDQGQLDWKQLIIVEKTNNNHLSGSIAF